MIFDFKRNYRCLLRAPASADLVVFSVGRNTAPLAINALTPPPGVEFEEPKAFYWRGESALRIARFFGIDSSRAATIRLRESYELYRLDETHHDKWLTDGPKSRLLSPRVYATIRFTPGRDPRLTLDGMFFNAMTGFPQHRPEWFFTSAFIRDHGAIPEGWRPLFRGQEETRSAGAPFRDVTASVVRGTDYDAPNNDPGYFVSVQIADQ
jgi:hypothetical protein